MIVIPQSSLLSASNHLGVSNQFYVSLLDKYPRPANSSKGTATLLSLHRSFKVKQASFDSQGAHSSNQHMSDLEVSSSLMNSMWLLTHTQTITLTYRPDFPLNHQITISLTLYTKRTNESHCVIIWCPMTSCLGKVGRIGNFIANVMSY